MISLLVLVAVLILIQDVMGPLMCSIFGMDPKVGLCLDSIGLIGGHETTVSYGEQLVDEFGIANADTIAATFDLTVSGFISSPLTKRHIERSISIESYWTPPATTEKWRNTSTCIPRT